MFTNVSHSILAAAPTAFFFFFFPFLSRLLSIVCPCPRPPPAMIKVSAHQYFFWGSKIWFAIYYWCHRHNTMQVYFAKYLSLQNNSNGFTRRQNRKKKKEQKLKIRGYCWLYHFNPLSVLYNTV